MTPLAKLMAWARSYPGRASTILLWCNQVFSIAANLVILPLVLYRVGRDANIWYFLLTWIGFFIILDFGFTQCISRQITYSTGETGFLHGRPKGRFLRVGGPRSLGNIIVASRSLFRYVSIIVGVTGIVAERTFLFSGNMTADISAHICWYEIIFVTILGNEMRVYGTALSGMLFVFETRLIGVTQNVLQNLLIIIFLIISPRLELLGLSQVIAQIVGTVLVFRLWRKCSARVVYSHRTKKRMVWRLWLGSWEQGWASAANYFTGAVNPILIGYLITDKNAVATYYLPLRIATILFAGVADIVGAQLNFLIQLYRDRDIHGFLVKFFRLFTVSGALCTVAYGGFALLGPWAVSLWSLGKIHPPVILFWIMSLYWWLAMMQTLFGLFIIAHGLQPFARPATSGAILNLVGTFLLVPRYGVVGAALATFLAQLLTSNWYLPWYSARLFREHFAQVPFKQAAIDTWLSLERDLARLGLRFAKTKGQA